MEVEANQRFDQFVAYDPQRRFRRDERRELRLEAIAEQNRFERIVAGQQPSDELLAFDDESASPARAIGVFQIPIGLQSRIVDRIDELARHRNGVVDSGLAWLSG